jgi:PBSX family phage terminase large subunit
MTPKFHKRELVWTAPQLRYRQSKALFRALCGGRGAGKSTVGTADVGIRASQKRGTYLIAAPTYQMLRDSTWRSFEDTVGEKMGLIGEVRRGDNMSAKIAGTGSEILFRSTDEPDRLRGPNLSGAYLDEGSLMEKKVFDITIACLREHGKQGWMSATFTPRGKLHWTFEVFGSGRPNTELIFAPTSTNTFLPENFVRNLREQYTSALAAQELEGQFTDLEGTMFRRDWFGIVEAAPKIVYAVRAWDMAATEVKDGNDPDWTAGVLIGRLPNNTYCILDVVHCRATPQNVEQIMLRAAERDPPGTQIWCEEEPGSAGKTVISHLTRNVFAGYSFRGERSTGPKSARAQPLAAMAESGNIKLLRGYWNKSFLDEAECFPLGTKDDQIDAASLAFSKVAMKGPSVPDPKMLAEIERSYRHVGSFEDRLTERANRHVAGAGRRWLDAMAMAGTPFGFKPDKDDSHGGSDLGGEDDWLQRQYLGGN